MPTLAPPTGPAPQEPHHLLDGAPTDPTATGAARGCPDERLERPDHTRLVPTWSVHARPTLAFQRRLIAGLVG